MTPQTLGIDFGTSNSAAGIAVNGRPWLVELEPGENTLPTAVFFEVNPTRMKIGRSATRGLINGDEGRFLRALKSLLGTPLLHEQRRLGGERLTFVTIIARFLGEVKKRAEAQTRIEFTHALSGRPVRFHSADEARNAQAEEDLRACYKEAGFQDVTFMYEPEAALRAAKTDAGLGLVVDIGGGTSDFTAFVQEDGQPAQILASHGVRLGGTDFDRQISIDHVMPLLGRGTQINNAMGSGSLTAPARLFNDLATWQMIPFLYNGETRRMAEDLHRHAQEPEKLARLVSVLEEEVGHDLAFAVEAGKIAANTPAAEARIDLRLLERGLAAPLAATEMHHSLTPSMETIRSAAAETLTQAGVTPTDVTRLVLVGGSSLLTTVQSALADLCPNGVAETDNAMTAVADGLALAAPEAFAKG
ncbi:Hsp70 family protein [Epibacterium sp. SM1979]|uniref:Hsp70 family protein n=1 Tax=Tritonibacter litoralis TaxID=2662264 RepID=A0A843Y7P9_9RHOB|nr:Hsp70 family protein [Tritonibacter litoralis]MQQ06886.1 Hsp70 family protein [Tritonibacter litoralis]